MARGRAGGPTLPGAARMICSMSYLDTDHRRPGDVSLVLRFYRRIRSGVDVRIVAAGLWLVGGWPGFLAGSAPDACGLALSVLQKGLGPAAGVSAVVLSG